MRQIMKDGIHPDYREVVFHDMSNDFKFITRSTVQTREKIEFEGKQIPIGQRSRFRRNRTLSTPANTKSSIPQVAWTSSARSSVPLVPKPQVAE
jgi:ribosomal protein L31